ncbi:methyl-accepting chemotaxis protein [Paenibacillus koleovorans]|uniref:methyl-accepting chemotaxis protein n=1 Tax=Paenibacillus koleovorans TaxID=121608 RepID=UPI0013E401C5|nr:methyl-accepting chemotaxis protein [Paenibacillus koleovorans]
MDMNIQVLLDHGQLLRKPTGEILFRSGDHGEEMFVVLSGTIEIFLEQEGCQISVAKLGPGDFLGEMSLLEGLPRSGTAITATPCELVSLGHESFRKLMNEDSVLTWRIMKGLSTRIRTLNQELAQRIGEDLQEMSRSLHEHAQWISSSIKQIAVSAQEIDANEKLLVEQTKEVQGISKEIGGMLQFIQHVASQTHILGLNAAIEAARNGENGRGFGVIANEIRKLSSQSSTNAEQIAELTELIWLKMDKVTIASESSAVKSNEQAFATQQMVKAIEEVAGLAERLAGIAKSLA